MEPILEAADSAADAILSTDHSQATLAAAAGIATVDCPVVSSVQADVNRTTGLDAAERIPAGLEQAIQLTCRWLFDRQHADGHWCGELEGDSILQSEYILLLAWLGEERTEPALRAARRLLEQQNPDGGWGMFPGSEMDISASVKAYFALKLTGHDPQSRPLRLAREAILRGGGADRVNSFTRFYLALLGQIDYRHCPAVPPEAVLLPKWSPINIYRVSAWSRTILVPLAIMWAFRPARELPAELGIDELMLEPPERWPALRCPGRSGRRKFFSWESLFQITDKSLKLAERIGFRPLRRRALSVARQWMLDRFADSDGLGAIFPPIVWSWIALRCLGYENNSPEVRECRRQLEDLMLSDSDDGPVRLQPCKSPVWDTAITLRALAGAGFGANHPDARRAIDWLLDREVRSAGDWSEYVRAEPSGWFFEYRNKFYPDVDDTIMVMMALSDQRRAVESSAGSSVESRANERLENPAELDARMEAACQRARRWTLAMQNRDGGWGAFDRDNDCELLCHVPFADHNAMIDPSTPDITARVLESLAPFGDSPGDTAVERAIAYLRGTQESDGSWYGRWGVNYIYGTWQTIVGLVRIGVPIDDPMIQRAADWLERHQQSNGGWGESARSYEDARYRGRGPATPSQTAWALLGLIAAGRAEHDCARRGVDYLLAEQRPDGSWDETEFTGTGFPLVFYLRYHMYRIYFPLLALTDWRQAISRDT